MVHAPVLLVDDDPVVLRVHAAAVKSFGFRTQYAETAEEALDLIDQEDYALVISDVQMPGEGGFDLVRQLWESGQKRMPVLYLTGYDDLEIIRSGLRVGGDDFLGKGQSVNRLRERIAFWMASGFQGLPKDIRRRAIAEANTMEGDSFTGMKSSITCREPVVDRVMQAVEEELALVPLEYGERLIERMFIMARVAKLCIEHSDGLGDYVRFPDHMYQVMTRIKPGWRPAFQVLFGQFDDWAKDYRFIRAGAEPLAQIDHYDWPDPEDISHPGHMR